jgi:hypothetical protein
MTTTTQASAGRAQLSLSFEDSAAVRPPYIVRIGGLELETTVVYDSLWSFAAERQRMLYRRLRGDRILTRDPILKNNRFTNAFRAADRVSQYLIAHVLPNSNEDPRDVLTRLLIFKLFNKIETWQTLERDAGAIHWPINPEALSIALDNALAHGETIYSSAYIMANPPGVSLKKHRNHIALVSTIVNDGLAERMTSAPSLGQVYQQLLEIPSFGPFLAFQLAIDWNYSHLGRFSENDFVVAGPGALNGIAKCFVDTRGIPPHDIIRFMTQGARAEFSRLGIVFANLFGRDLRLIDTQNCLCETDKYARAKYPEFNAGGRSQIKQRYQRPNTTPLTFTFPQSWGLNTNLPPNDLVPVL